MKRRNPYPGVSAIFDRHGVRRWRLRRTIKGRKIDCYLPGAYGSTEFRTTYEEAVAGGNVSGASRAKPASLKWLCEQYLRSARYSDRAEGSKRVLRKELDWLMDQCGDLPFAKFEARHVEAIMARKTGPAAANKVKKNMSILFNYGIKKGFGITFNPARYADKWKENPDGFHTWTDAEINQYQTYHAKGTKARLALELFLWTGASRQDAARMGWQNVNGDHIEYTRGKTGITAFLPVHPDLANELAKVPRGQMLFLTHGEKAKPYKPETLGSWFKDQCVAAGLLHCTAHGLRKSLGTLMANEGRSPDQSSAGTQDK